jgi:thioredoxin-like negative regulator of GroEL
MVAIKYAAKILSLAVLLLVDGSAAKAQQTSITWLKDLERASEVAQKNNQPMMIEFWADWCASCKTMDENIFTDPKLVAAVRDRIVPVRIHFDLQKDLVRRYNVPALPYVVFANSNGTELMHHRGILGAADYTALIQALPADVSELNRLDRALQANKNDFESLVAMGRELRAAGFFPSSNEYYGRALKQNEAKNDPATRERILFAMGLNFLELQDARQAVQTLERCLKEFPESANKPEVLLNLAHAYLLNEQKVKARKSLETLIEAFPQSEASRKAKVLLKSV